jgi:hypothetical protein
VKKYIVQVIDNEGGAVDLQTASHPNIDQAKAEAIEMATEIVTSGYWFNDMLIPPHRIHTITIRVAK